MLKDLRHGLRTLLRDKGWTAVVVLSLALGIGANTALFSAINGLFLKKLAVRDPDTLVRLDGPAATTCRPTPATTGSRPRTPPVSTSGARSPTRCSSSSSPTTARWRISSRARRTSAAPTSRSTARPTLRPRFIASGNYYRVLGLTANPGRTIVPEDDQPTAPPVAVISSAYWRTRFGGDPTPSARRVQLNNVPVTIVGVISPEFIDVQQAVQAKRPTSPCRCARAAVRQHANSAGEFECACWRSRPIGGSR